jgi:hypothetical protein
MPLVAQVLHPKEKNRKLFQCTVNDTGTSYCHQCKFITAKGSRCKLKSCLDLDYCWIHLSIKYKVKIAPSKIKVNGKSIGLGLFARTNKPLSSDVMQRVKSRRVTQEDKAKYIVFRPGDVIGKYMAEKVDAKELSRRYDYMQDGKLVEQTAPYAVSKNSENIFDSLCHRNFVSYANDARGTEFGNNAELSPQLYLKAKRVIWEGEEILWNYKQAYWDTPVADVRYHQTKSRTSNARRRRH